MKRIVLLCLALFITESIAQYKVRTVEPDFIDPGGITIGGSISFSNQSYERSADDKTVITFTPAVAYFFFKRLSAGISVHFNNVSVGSTTSTDWAIGPSVRYYFTTKRFAPFAGAGFAYGVSTSSINDDKFKTTQFILTAGADYFLIKNVALEVTLNYHFITEKYPDSYSVFLNNLVYNSRQIALAAGVNIFL